jgi:protocatechuate 4,5-dioxygenase beta chain/2,3-dihydroxyphenylpropionate 1,2-dioxygenase
MNLRLTHAALRDLGDRLAAADVDAMIIFAGDHLNNFFDTAVAPFTVFTADIAEGPAGRNHVKAAVDHELAQAILEGSIDADFDVAYSQRGKLESSMGAPLHFMDPDSVVPIVPIYINQYLSPLPRPQRCFAWGQQIRRIIEASGKRVAVFASGGMSHFPGTPRYSHPEFEWDRWFLSRIGAGDWSGLRDLTIDDLDEHGNTELLQWFAVMGILGDAVPGEVLTYQPCWHHGYGVVDWSAALGSAT